MSDHLTHHIRPSYVDPMFQCVKLGVVRRINIMCYIYQVEYHPSVHSVDDIVHLIHDNIAILNLVNPDFINAQQILTNPGCGLGQITKVNKYRLKET